MRWFCAIAVVLLAGCGAADFGLVAPTPTGSTTATALPATSVPQLTSVPTAEEKILTEMSGDGNGQTALFTVTGPWAISYTYDCTGRSGTIVSLDVWDVAGKRIPENFHQGTMKPGTGADVVHLATPGTWLVHVGSICRWHLTVRG